MSEWNNLPRERSMLKACCDLQVAGLRDTRGDSIPVCLLHLSVWVDRALDMAVSTVVKKHVNHRVSEVKSRVKARGFLLSRS